MAEVEEGQAPATSGREQKRKTKAAQLRTPDFSRYYKQRIASIRPGDFVFHLDLLRPHSPALLLDQTVESFDWTDEQSTLTGSLTLHRPDIADPLSLPITRGHQVRCRCEWHGGTRKARLWTMRAEAPQIEVETGVVTVPLKDDLSLLDGSELDWLFRATKHRPHGWLLHEIVAEVARRLHVRIGKCIRGTVRMTLVQRGKSGLDVIKAACAKEKQSTKHSVIIRMRDGKVEVVPLGYNPQIYVLEKEIQTALIAQKAGAKVPVTVIHARGHIGSGKKTKKVSHVVYNRAVVRALGHVPKTKDYGQVRSHKELRDLATRDLAAGLRMNDTITIAHQGIPFIARGDVANVNLPLEGYKGKDAFVFATRAVHTVQAGVYQTEWDFVAKDPVLAQKEADKKAAEKRVASSSGIPGAVGGGPRWLVKASAEDDPPGASASCGPLPGDRRGYSVLSVSGLPGDAGTAGQALSPGSVWPCGITMNITNPSNGRTVTGVPHVDNGAGSSFRPVVGIYPQTRAELGLSGGEFDVIIQRTDGGNMSPNRGRQV